MERKQPKVANAIDSDHAAGNPSFPWGHRPVHGLPKRKKEKGKNKIILTTERGILQDPLVHVLGDLKLTLSASLVSK